MDLSNYQLDQLPTPTDLADLADQLFWNMAEAIRFDPRDLSEDVFLEFMLAFGPNKELRLNIDEVKERLGPNGLQTAAEWVKRSGALHPISGAFADPAGIPVPSRVGTVVWSGGVANWMLRRRGLTERLDPQKVGRVILPMGSRLMGEGEHQLVASATEHGRRPTEAEFAHQYIERWLRYIGFRNVEVLRVHSEDLDEIHQVLFNERPHLLDDTSWSWATPPSPCSTPDTSAGWRAR